MRNLLTICFLSFLDLTFAFPHGNNPRLFGNVSNVPVFHRRLIILREANQPKDVITTKTAKDRRLPVSLASRDRKAKFSPHTVLRGGAVLVIATPPALTTWLPPALLCALAYALYNLFLKQASSSIDSVLGGVLLQIVAAVLGAALLGVRQLLVIVSKKGNHPLQWNRLGVAWAVAAGAAVGTAEILSFIISGMGVPASKSIPTIIGGSVLMGTVLGALWLGERLTLRRGWLGIVLIAVGIGLVGMDPGSSLH